jgi:hypothetical protein
LLWTSDTFEKNDKFGMILGLNIDCLYKNKDLFFKSFYKAKQVLDLTDYYLLATDSEINEFINNDKFYMENKKDFNNLTDIWIRKKISSINKTGVLNNLTIDYIIDASQKYTDFVNIEKRNNKLYLPNDKNELKKILKFLDEDLYQGELSYSKFETNSKRKF